MATTRPFAYNTGSTIDGTIQLGNLSIGVSDQDYSQNPGGVKWWMGPDEELGYVIAHEVSPCDQPTPIEIDACLGFWRSDVLTEQSFVDLFNVIPPRIGQTKFTNGNSAKTWLNDNGYWTSYDNNLPTPTSTSVLPTATPTPTPSNVPSGTPTPTPTETDIPSTPTPTPSPTEIPPTGTPEPTATEVLPTETPTNTPTNTPTPTATPVSATPTPTPTATTPSCDITYNIIDVTPTPTATLPACDVTYNIVDTTPTPTPTDVPPTNTPTPTPTVTPTPTYYYYFLLNCDLVTNAYGRSLNPDINLSGFTFNVGTNLCYTIIGQENDPYYDYDLDMATIVTDCTDILCPTPTPTPTPTEVPPTPTPTPTPTSTDVPSTPTPTATEVPPTPTPTDVNLCNGIPYTLSSTYSPPGSGITVWGTNTLPVVASNLVNTLAIQNPFFFSRYDSNGVDRLSYFGNGISSSFTLTICQNNNSAIYTGTSSAMTYSGGGNSFRVSAIDLTLTQSSPLSAFTFNELVYIELSSYNGQPTPTATEATPTNTPTPTPTSTDVPSTPTPTATEVPPTPTPTATEVASTPTPTPTSGATSTGLLTFSEVGSDVVMSVSGTIDLSGLTLVDSNMGPFMGGGIGPTSATFLMGANGGYAKSYSGFTTTPSNFGTGGGAPPTSTSGDIFGIVTDGTPPYLLIVPTGYTSGTNISSTQTFTGQTFTTLGLTVGTYTYTWSGGSIDVVVSGVPGPTPTPTSTGGGAGVGEWYFYSDEGTINANPPTLNGNAIFTINTGGSNTETFNPNKSSGVTFLYFNVRDSIGTNYTSQFSGYTGGTGTITISQNGDTATYTSTTPGSFFIETNVGGGSPFFVIAANPCTQTKSSNASFVYGDPISITFGGSPTPTNTPAPTATEVPPTNTPAPTATEVPPTSTPLPTATDVPSTPTPTATETPTPTPTSTEVPPTSTPTPTPTPTSTEVPPTGTPTPTPTATDIPPTNTPSPTPTPTSTPVPPTGTPVPTATPTSTPVPPTGTPVPTATPTSTPVPTSTPTPTPTATPDQTPNWINSGSYNCYSTCNKYNVEIDNNVNSLSYNTTRQGSLVESNSTFCGGCCGQSTVANWTNEGDAYCDSCVSKQSQRDTNSCSGTYNQTRVINSGSACSTVQNWSNTGSYDCYSTCNKYNVEIQDNPCASGYTTTRQGSLVESNSTFCGGCCGQSTAANWQWNELYVCDGYTQYQQEVDNNTCSPTYGQTRTGTFVLFNSAYCGYVPPPTPTVTPTATPTPPVGYDFYYADEYECADPCGVIAVEQFVAFPAGSSVINNKFYSWSGGTNSYKITGTAVDPGVIIPLLYPIDGPLNNCTQACGVS